MTRRLSVVLSLCLLGLIFSASAQASGGTVSAWGYNYFGQVANGQTNKTGCYCVQAPVSTGVSGVTQLAGGYSHTLYLLSDGSVKSVGFGGDGELGYPVATPYEITTPTTIPGLSGVIAIAAPGDNGYALLANGTVMAWGENESGQLGIGTSTGPEECQGDPCATHPVPVPGLSGVVAIAAGGESVFALLANGTVMAWGNDEYGQLGDGVGSQDGCECVDHPVGVPGVTNAIAISAGESWAGAVLADHSVIAWGENYDGQLGTGNTEYNNTDCYCRGPVKTLTGVKALSAGAYHGAAIMLDGSVKAWGYNYYGELGSGQNERLNSCQCDATPTTIPAYAGAQAIDASYYDTFAVMGDGTVHGSGYNYYGELGDGTTEERVSPVSAYGVAGASDVMRSAYYGGGAIIGPSQTLSVAIAGAGTGTVQGGEVSCPTICAAKYPQGKVVNLTATSTNGGFAGFTGPCTGTATCQAKMETDQTVTATFGVPAGTTITKAKILSPKKKATFSFSAPGAITGYQCKLNRPKPKPKKGKAKKQKKPKFANCKSAKIYKNLKPGKYTFRVRALDVLGADAKPAKRAFKIHPPKKKKHKKKH